MENKRFFWLQGIGVFILEMAVFIILGVFLQLRYGLWGVMGSEALILGVAVVAAIAMGINLWDMLRVKLPKIRQIVGVVIMTISGSILAGGAAYVYLFFFPDGLQVVDTLQDITAYESNLAAWLILATLPAICEEVMHRGLILYTFVHSGFKSKWTIIVSMGVLFGLFHLDFSRFFTTAILGMILTYVAMETGNFLMPVLYHLINNSLSVFALSMTDEIIEEGALSAEVIPYVAEEFVGVILFLSAFALFSLRLGARLLGPKAYELDEAEALALKQSRKASRLYTVLLSVLLIVAGVLMMFMSDTSW